MLRESTKSDIAERGVAVSREAAREWLHGLGYDVEPSGALIRAGGDSVRGRSFALARIWHDAASIRRRGGHRGIAVSIVVQGSVRVSQGSSRLLVSQGEGFISALADEAGLDAEGPVGTIELRASEAFSRRFDVPSIDGTRLLSSTIPVLPALVAFANATLASGPDPHGVTWPLKQAALENSMAALMLEMTEESHDSLVDRATTEIRKHATDPQFDVTALAASQGVTLRWLQSEFSGTGTTPHRALLAERLRVARNLLHLHPRISTEEAARRSGFSSARALRDALRADERRR